MSPDIREFTNRFLLRRTFEIRTTRGISITKIQNWCDNFYRNMDLCSRRACNRCRDCGAGPCFFANFPHRAYRRTPHPPSPTLRTVVHFTHRHPPHPPSPNPPTIVHRTHPSLPTASTTLPTVAHLSLRRPPHQHFPYSQFSRTFHKALEVLDRLEVPLHINAHQRIALLNAVCTDKLAPANGTSRHTLHQYPV